MNKQRVFLVSPPRSGHHMLSDFLAESLGPSFTYCRMYRCIDNKARWLECEARDWPPELKVGCRSGRRYQKNHDFDLSLKISELFRYVVLVRHPIYSLTSWWVYHRGRTATDSEISLEKFMTTKVDYWKDFVNKWMLQGIGHHIMVVKYEDIVSDPYFIRSILKFVNYDHEPATADMFDSDFLEENVRPPRDLRSEPHFDATLYNRIQDMIGVECLRSIGYEPIGF